MIRKISVLSYVFLCICVILTAANKAATKNQPNCSNEFNRFFKFEKKVNLSEKKNLVARVRQFLIAHNGNYLILDSKKNKIHTYTPKGEFVSSIGGRGQGPGEFLQVYDFAIDRENMYVIDPIARKVNLFTTNGKFKHFFSIEDGRLIQPLKNGELVIAAPVIIGANESACIHIYKKSGKLKRSFFPINKNAKNNLISDGVNFDMDEEDILYCVQEMDYKVHLYNLSGQLLKTFAEPQSYYIPPTDKGNIKTYMRSQLLKWLKSWTHILGIHTINDYVIVTLKYSRLPYEYVFDVYNKKGEFIKGGLGTNYRLLYTDKKQYLYFLDESINADSKDASYNILVYSLKGKDQGRDGKKKK